MRHGWTLTQWADLTEQEREIWLAWELRRERELEEIIAQFQQTRMTETGHEYSAWEPAAAAVLLAARLG